MKKLLRSLFAALLFFAITMPFREFFRVMPVTEIRPVSALPPALGLIWGFPGALGCAIGNLIADFLSGYHPLMCILGFPVQLFYGLFPLLMWKFLNKAKAARNPFIRLNNVKNALRYIAIILIDSLITAALLGLLMKEFEIVPFYSSSTLILFLNNFVFCMALGVPIIIFSTIIRIKTHHIDITLNERLALILLLICVISAGITGVFSYLELSRSINDTLSLWNQIYLYIAIEQIIFHIMALTILSYLEKNITIPIESIARIAKNYINSDKEKTDSLSIASQCEKFTKIQNEAGALAQSFRKMVLDLDKYIINLTAVTGEKERFGAELNIARRIQTSQLPSKFPAFPECKEFDIFAIIEPAKEVGGDFYDFYLIDDATLAVVIADVSGKGVPAALFMAIAKTLVLNNAQQGKSPKEVFNAVNNILCENNDENMFISAFMGYLDIYSGKFTYINAGHNPPLVRKSDKVFNWLHVDPGLVLAVFKDIQLMQHEITLNSGDVLFLYTDGVPEAFNAQKEMFSNAGLLEALNKKNNCNLVELLHGIQTDLDLFCNGTEQADDITMLALKKE